MIGTVTCAWCGGEMHNRKATARYCNSTCRARASEARKDPDSPSATFWAGIRRCRRSVALRRRSKSTRLDSQ